jgi:eukaryotic-like serine/threonine-protein kinase
MSQVSVFPLIAGRYRLDCQVAADRFGEVWRGTDVELARPVAVKMLHDGVSADAVRQFRDGASRAGSLSHEGVVRIFDYCDLDPSEPTHRPLVVMEYVDGQSLANRLRERPLEAAQAVDIIAQVSAAVNAVHQAGLVHGDIRPEKILLSTDGEAKLFGFSGAGSAANGADLRALGVLVRDLLIEHTKREHGRLPEQLRTAVAEFAALSINKAADRPDATAVFADRAAELAVQLGHASSVAGGPGQSAGQAVSSRVPTVAPPAPIPAAESPESALAAAGLPRQATRPMAALVGRRPAQPGTRKPANRFRVIAVRTSAVIAVAVAAVAIFGAVRPNDTTQEAKGASQAASVRITAARLMGRPVHVVRLRLQRLGLVVRIRWQHSDRVNAGDVMAVRPTGLVAAHSTVVVVGSRGPSGTGSAQAPATIRHRHSSRAPHRTTSRPATPTPSSSPTSSPSPSPSPTSSPPPSGSPSPSASASPPSTSSPPTSALPSSTPSTPTNGSPEG